MCSWNNFFVSICTCWLTIRDQNGDWRIDISKLEVNSTHYRTIHVISWTQLMVKKNGNATYEFQSTLDVLPMMFHLLLGGSKSAHRLVVVIEDAKYRNGWRNDGKFNQLREHRSRRLPAGCNLLAIGNKSTYYLLTRLSWQLTRLTLPIGLWKLAEASSCGRPSHQWHFLLYLDINWSLWLSSSWDWTMLGWCWDDEITGAIQNRFFHMQEHYLLLSFLLQPSGRSQPWG